MKKIFLFPVLFSTLLFACKPDPIDIKLPPHQPKTVVGSQIIPIPLDSAGLLVLMLSRSFSSLTGNGDSLTRDSAFLESILLDHALVTVSHGAETDTFTKLTTGLYLCPKPLQDIGNTYSLYIRDSSNGQESRSSSVLLGKAPFADVHPVIERTPKDTTVFMEYTINDNPNETNYYMVNVSLPIARSSLQKFSFNTMGQNAKDIVLLSDQTFKDNKFSIKQQISASQRDTIAFSLSNISQQYYEYMVDYQKSGSLFNQITGEPISMPTNIQNGYGFFNINFPDIRVFDLSKY